MVKVNFIINKYYLASYIIQYNKEGHIIDYAKVKYQKDIVSFQNLAFDKSIDMCRLIEGRYSLKDYLFVTENTEGNLTKTIIKYLDELTKSQEFKKLLQQTKESVEKCKEEWEKNFTTTSKYIKDLGIELNGEFNILMVHPAMRAGQYLGNNKICWSNQTYWRNYNTVYIWHEVLHSYFNNNDAEHAIIEFITDEHLRKILNKTNYPPFVGHKSLEKIKSKNLILWNNFINNKNKDIHRLVSNFENL